MPAIFHGMASGAKTTAPLLRLRRRVLRGALLLTSHLLIHHRGHGRDDRVQHAAGRWLRCQHWFDECFRRRARKACFTNRGKRGLQRSLVRINRERSRTQLKRQGSEYRNWLQRAPNLAFLRRNPS